LTTELTDRALALARSGFKVFPVAAGAKAPPLVLGWPVRASSDPEIVRQFWVSTPRANIGIHCEGLLVLDIDPKKGGEESYAGLDMLHGPIAPTLEVRTPSGGRHLYFRLPEGHPGVSNSVGALGPGLDIRSTGGYVVGPGSETPAGGYQWASRIDRPIAPAPAWLVARLGTVAPKVRAADLVPDASPDAVARAKEWLSAQVPAVEGQGGDLHTYKAACGLRDRGLSRGQALDLLAEWNERCLPPWDLEALSAKAANAYRYAENEPGSWIAKPEDFPPVYQDNVVQYRPRVRILSRVATDDGPALGYVIKGILQRACYAEIYGAPGEGKTFIALDWSYHVAAGLPWMERRTKPGVVLYLAYEGQGGLASRAKALRQKYGAADVPLYVADAMFNLRDMAGRRELGTVIAELPAKPVLIVIDTFARALMGGDENSAQDVGAFNAGVAALIENTGACVLILHHSGKDKSKGARGSSALLGALDTEIEIDSGWVTAKKQREGELGDPIAFKLVPVAVGMDEDNEVVTSCVVEPSTGLPAGLPKLKGYAWHAFAALQDLSPTNAPVDPAEWEAECDDIPSRKPLDAKQLARRFGDMMKALLGMGYVEKDERGWIKRKMT
jgi:hypothetical protein